MLFSLYILCHFFFFHDPATTEIYTLSLHDALPISSGGWMPFGGTSSPTSPTSSRRRSPSSADSPRRWPPTIWSPRRDRKSTRLNSSHMSISYAVFCLKKKKKKNDNTNTKIK